MINTGRPVAVVARKLGIQEETLRRWANLLKIVKTPVTAC